MVSVGDFVEAVDECGHWAAAKVTEVLATMVLVTFVGWSSRFNRWVGNDDVRLPSATESAHAVDKRPKRKGETAREGQMRRLVQGDKVRVSEDGIVFEAEHFLAFIMYGGLVGVGEINYTITPTIIADLFSHDSRTKMLMIFYFPIPVGRTFAAYSYVATQLKKFVDYYKQKDGTMFINEVHME